MQVLTGDVGRHLELARKPLLATIRVAALAVPLAIGLMHPPRMQAQSQAAASLRFIATSVKLAADQNIMSTRPTRTVGRFRWNTSVVFMIGYAYHLELWRISEAPGLTSLDVIYDVEATNPPNATEDQVRLMLQLSADLQKHLGTTVLDQTGLTGRYNFELTCPRAASSDEFPGLLASCVKQAGLRLEKYKGVVDFLVIDKIGPFVEN